MDRGAWQARVHTSPSPPPLPRILAWKIPWSVQSMSSQRVGHDQVRLSLLCNFCLTS